VAHGYCISLLNCPEEVFGPCGDAMLAISPPLVSGPMVEPALHVGANTARYSRCGSMDVRVVTLSHGTSELTEMPQVFSSHSGM
jgi:hypothetical protein